MSAFEGKANTSRTYCPLLNGPNGPPVPSGSRLCPTGRSGGHTRPLGDYIFDEIEPGAKSVLKGMAGIAYLFADNSLR